MKRSGKFYQLIFVCKHRYHVNIQNRSVRPRANRTEVDYIDFEFIQIQSSIYDIFRMCLASWGSINSLRCLNCVHTSKRIFKGVEINLTHLYHFGSVPSHLFPDRIPPGIVLFSESPTVSRTAWALCPRGIQQTSHYKFNKL